MLSSYKVIKNSSVVSQGDKAILTDYNAVRQEEREAINLPLEACNNLSERILQNAKVRSEEIIREASINAALIEKEANSKGYDKGYNAGKEEAKEKAYSDYVNEAKAAAQSILEEAAKVKKEALELLLNSKLAYENYLIDKKHDIKELSLNIAEAILKKEFTQSDALNIIVEDVLTNEKKGKTFIIRCNSVYTEELKKFVETIKDELTVKCDIFILKDDTVNLGNVVIEKENGKIEAGIDKGLNKVRQVLEENE